MIGNEVVEFGRVAATSRHCVAEELRAFGQIGRGIGLGITTPRAPIISVDQREGETSDSLKGWWTMGHNSSSDNTQSPPPGTLSDGRAS